MDVFSEVGNYPSGEFYSDKMASQISEGKHSFDMDLLRTTQTKRILVKGRMQPLCSQRELFLPGSFAQGTPITKRTDF